MDNTMIVKRPPAVATGASGRPAEAPAPGSRGYSSLQQPAKAMAVDNLDGTCIVPRRPAATAPQPIGTVLNLHSSAGQKQPLVAESLDGTCVVPRRPSPAAPVVPPEAPGTIMDLHSSPGQPPPEPKELPFLLSSALQRDGKKGPMSVQIVPEDQPFSDTDLLSSVPDERIDIDECENLFSTEGASIAATEAFCKKKEAEREFGIDGTRRRTPIVQVSLPDARASGRDATPPRFVPGRVMEGGAPMAKRLSRRK